MAVKHKTLYLYLALACFLALVVIFIFDGYMGVYDSLSVTAGEKERKVEADYWLRENGEWSVGVMRGGNVLFQYEVDNRQFSSYTADVEVAVWRNQEKVSDVTVQPISLGSFDKGQVEWVLKIAEIIPPDLPPEQRYNFTVVIKRGEIERNVLVYVSEVLKPVIPAPPR